MELGSCPERHTKRKREREGGREGEREREGGCREGESAVDALLHKASIALLSNQI